MDESWFPVFTNPETHSYLRVMGARWSKITLCLCPAVSFKSSILESKAGNVTGGSTKTPPEFKVFSMESCGLLQMAFLLTASSPSMAKKPLTSSTADSFSTRIELSQSNASTNPLGPTLASSSRRRSRSGSSGASGWRI